MKSKKIFSVLLKLLSVIITLSLVTPAFTAFAEQNTAAFISDYRIKRRNTVYIRSREDFLDFAKNCVLDSNSADTNYILDCDIDLSGADFEPVPSFSGIFFGFNHNITGLSVKGEGSELGLFRYIEETGVVLDLNVRGTVTPAGKAENCGGIAGVNRGTICSCTFRGKVQGISSCGGIAGLNEKTGLVSSSESRGIVSADNFAGGAVGNNEGLIMHCVNYAAVNTEVREVSLDVTDVDIEEIRNGSQKKMDMSDSGGIAGFSSGAVYKCINSGRVGYQRVGYNVGGIVGRQTGYIEKCENRGEVFGRKDIGGIVGQAEPYVSVLFSESSRVKLKAQLDELSEAVDNAINDARASGDKLSGDNDRVNAVLEQVRGTTDGLLEDAEVIVNRDIDSVNELLSRVEDFISLIAPVFEDFAAAAEDGKVSFELLTDSIGKINEAAKSADLGIDSLDVAYENFSSALDSISSASKNISSGMEALEKSLGDTNETAKQLEVLNKSVSDFSDAMEKLSDAAEKAADAFRKKRDDTSEEREEIDRRIEDNLVTIKQSSDEMKQYADSLSADLDRLSEALDAGYIEFGNYVDILADITKDIKGITDAARNMPIADVLVDTKELIGIYEDIIADEEFRKYADEVRKQANRAGNDISDSAGAASAIGEQFDIKSLKDFITFLKKAGEDSSSAEEFLSIVKKELEEKYPFFSDAADFAMEAGALAEEASDRMTSAAEKLGNGLVRSKDTADYFSFKEKVSFTGVSDSIINSRRTVSLKLSELIDNLAVINKDALNTVRVLSDDLEEINRICGEIGDTVSDIVTEISETSADIEDYTEDISVQDTFGRSDGKVSSCINYGKTEGDLCVGGISGSMGAELEFDREGDIEEIGKRSADFVYRSKTIIRDCKNYGDTEAFKSQGGGIVGNMETGCVMNCESYGDTVCEESDYIGGIAGKSKAVIVGCSAMCSVGGSDYVGGIAGLGKDISDSISFVDIVFSDEKAGKIAGSAEGRIERNVFVDDSEITGSRSFGAIDGISYDGKAFPKPYKGVILKYNAPDEFENLRLKFILDDEVVAEVPYVYGESIDISAVPKCPCDKNGTYMVWEDFDYSSILFNYKIKAVEKNLLTSVVSDAARENGRNVFAVEGLFTETDKLSAEQCGENGEEWNVIIPGTEKNHIVRYLSCLNKDRTGITVRYADGRIENPTVSVDGSYIVFEVSDNEFTVAAAETPFSILEYLNLIIAVGAVIIIVLIIAAVKHHKKKSDKMHR